MIKIAFLFFALVPLTVCAQETPTKETDSVILTIDEVLFNKSTRSLVRKFAPPDSILRQFLAEKPEFLVLFEKGEEGILPLVSVKVLDSTFMQVEFSSQCALECDRLIWYLVDETLLKSGSFTKKYVPPTAMSECNGWAQSSVVTYYLNQTTYTSVGRSDACAAPTLEWAEGVPVSMEISLKLIDFVRELERFIDSN